jgi:hypothetical protein
MYMTGALQTQRTRSRVSKISQGLKGGLQEEQKRKEIKGKCTRGVASVPGSWPEALRHPGGNGLLGLIATGLGVMHVEVCQELWSIFGLKGQMVRMWHSCSGRDPWRCRRYRGDRSRPEALQRGPE